MRMARVLRNFWPGLLLGGVMWCGLATEPIPVKLGVQGTPPLPPAPVPVSRLRQAALAAANNPATPPPGIPKPPTVVRPAIPNLPAVPRTVSVPGRSGLAYDALVKTTEVTDGAADAMFTFAVTNVTSEDITINSVHTSCGCTAAKLPQQPWLLHPGDRGEVGATMHVAGKWGTVTKTLTVNSSKGTDVLTVRSVLPEANSLAAQRMSDRSRNMQVAAADRQAVFRNDCAKCHVEPTVGKVGKELYTAACGICHDGEHRASMVPALAGRPGQFDEAYWNLWVRNGKVGSLMPAFEMKQGGPLTEEQVKSLTSYLANEFALTSTIAPAALDLVKPAPIK